MHTVLGKFTAIKNHKRYFFIIEKRYIYFISSEQSDHLGKSFLSSKTKSCLHRLTFGLLVSNMPVERPIKRALWGLERRGETEREREVREEDESSTEDWAERMARAAARR